MKAFVGSIGILILTSVLPAIVHATDWAQPPLLCVEEVVPQVPTRACLDLSGVVDPNKDWPPDLSAEDLAYWKSLKFGAGYCRAEEVLRREEANPGSMRAGAVELAENGGAKSRTQNQSCLRSRESVQGSAAYFDGSSLPRKYFFRSWRN